MSNEPLRLLIIDDRKPDRVLLRDSLYLVLSNVVITDMERPPQQLSSLLIFDGLIIDQRLAGDLGTGLAREINAIEHRLPIMLCTGLALDAPELIGAYHHAWLVASKGDLARIVAMARAFARMCGVAKVARQVMGKNT